MRLIALLTAALVALSPTAAQERAASTTLNATPATPINAGNRLPPPAPPRIAAALTQADVDTWLDGFMPYAIRRGDVAGAVVVVVRDGKVLTERGFGYADAARRQPVDPRRTLFRPGSVSKLFTWTAVMQLVEQGRLNLDADVNRYIDFRIPSDGGRPITLRDILTHTAGFEEASKELFVSDPHKLVSLERALKRWTPHRVYAPGTTPAYSNYANALAGYIVQRVSGLPFDTYVEQHIFAPLGMSHSTFRQPLPANLAADMSAGYASGAGKPGAFEMISLAPAGSLSATGDDMAKFMIAHLDDGKGLLRPETARMMHSSARTLLPPLNRMLLGFYEHNRNGRRVITHGGDTRYFHSELDLWLNDAVGVFVSVNSTGRDNGGREVRSTLFESFADRYLTGPTPDGRVAPAVAAQNARALAGIYSNSRRSHSSFMAAAALLAQTNVSVNPDGTVSISGVHQLGGAPKTWRSIAPYIWRETDGSNRLAAQVVGDRVVRYSMDTISPFMVFDRVPWWLSSVWLLPALYASFAALLLAAIAWPAGALTRRRYSATRSLSRDGARAYRWSRAFGLGVALLLAGWMAVVARTFSPIGASDGVLRILQIASFLIFPAAPVLALWSAFISWHDGQTWPTRLWSITLVVACLVALWAAVILHLIGFQLYY